MCSRKEALNANVALNGLPWEVAEEGVAAAAGRLLPEGYAVEAVVLPIDKKGRRTGRALLALRGAPEAGAAPKKRRVG